MGQRDLLELSFSFSRLGGSPKVVLYNANVIYCTIISYTHHVVPYPWRKSILFIL